MLVLGIETSCDETAAAVVEDGRRIAASVVASQIRVHSPFGGVVPELASREHVDNISYVVRTCLEKAGADGSPLSWEEIGAVAATRGPGLVGALLVGMAYAKGLAFALGVPFYGVNHLEGHIHSVFLDHPDAELPALSLVVSGGHTSIFHMREPAVYEPVARTRDDAAGEALDKLAKFVGLGYPGGPIIDRLAPHGNPRALRFALPKITDQRPDFSFSGLKTAAVRYAEQRGLTAAGAAGDDPSCLPRDLLDLLASYQAAIIDQLLNRLERALEGREVRSIHVSGGVSCNSALRARTTEHFDRLAIPVYFPRPALTTDNAAMIAGAAAYRIASGPPDRWDLAADPNLALSSAPSAPRR
jgi:N6-L-threonylcarbamoyladenine synthase